LKSGGKTLRAEDSAGVRFGLIQIPHVLQQLGCYHGVVV
jgi:hypothetical protein